MIKIILLLISVVIFLIHFIGFTSLVSIFNDKSENPLLDAICSGFLCSLFSLLFEIVIYLCLSNLFN